MLLQFLNPSKHFCNVDVFYSSVPLLKDFPEDVLAKIADVVDEVMILIKRCFTISRSAVILPVAKTQA